MFLINFIKYIYKYKYNTMKMARQDEMIEVLSEEANYHEEKRIKSNNALRQISILLTNYEKGGSFYAPIYRQIKTIVDDSVELKLSDKILSHYNSDNA